MIMVGNLCYFDNLWQNEWMKITYGIIVILVKSTEDNDFNICVNLDLKIFAHKTTWKMRILKRVAKKSHLAL